MQAPSDPINMARKTQTLLEVQLVAEELHSWFCLRRERDVQRQYHTQLNCIEGLITGALTALQADFDDLDPTAEPGSFYEACRLVDLRLLWLRRVWYFFKEKFDQRDDPLIGPLLLAADEVVWSCYRQIFITLPGFATRGPAPLPFIEAQYSPEAFPVELVPASLKDISIGPGFLRTYLNQLPIPVVRLPPACAVAPWWLVAVGHEIGHHIQFDLNLVGWFREAVEQTIETAGGDKQDMARWGGWSQEVFADIFSVLVMGPWAVTAMIEFELAKASAMLQRRARYPAPLVRLKLLADTADYLGVDGRARTEAYGLDLDALTQSSSTASHDTAYIAQIIELALGQLPDLPHTLPELVMFRPDEFLDGGLVAEWAQAFLYQQDHYIDTDLRAARLVTSAVLAAWSELAKKLAPTQKQQPAQLTALAKRALGVIARSREEGTRDTAPDIEIGQPVDELARLLREADSILLE